ncbi:MAG: mandelate racemase/muconate lactonizing enzyme family protein [Desulfobacterales bacterium]|nr:mandelate racemase/muconate lactonizing enzyme family protein [Desulfobacterales bacterium]
MFAEIDSAQGYDGLGFSYALRCGGAGQFAHACEIAPLIVGEDPNDISKIWSQLLWAGASVGRSGIAVQAMAAIDIALWDMKAKRARLPLAKLIGAYRDSVPCYNTSGGYLQAPIEEILEKADRSLERGIQGVKIKVGQPDMAADLKRVEALRKHLGDEVPIMVDANQQWDRMAALRFGRQVEALNLAWIEEPLDAYDAEGHAALAAAIDTPVATGEMLSSVDEHRGLITHGSVDIIQPDAPRIGGITPFLRLADLADQAGLGMAPHFVMEIHIHLAACYPREPWLEHFEWLEPLFNERLKINNGQIEVPNQPGLGFSLSTQMRQWTMEAISIE